jgi:hypothetical protein
MITMAAGKNDVIKLLPPLTLSATEADSFLTALDAVLSDGLVGAARNWAEVQRIAVTTLGRSARSGGTSLLARTRRGRARR